MRGPASVICQQLVPRLRRYDGSVERARPGVRLEIVRRRKVVLVRGSVVGPRLGQRRGDVHEGLSVVEGWGVVQRAGVGRWSEGLRKVIARAAARGRWARQERMPGVPWQFRFVFVDVELSKSELGREARQGRGRRGWVRTGTKYLSSGGTRGMKGYAGGVATNDTVGEVESER